MKNINVFIALFAFMALISGCVNKIPSQNHTQEEIVINLAHLQTNNTQNIPDSPSDITQGEYIDSTSVLEDMENSQSITLKSIYITDLQQSKDRFMKRLNEYYSKTPSASMASSLVSMSEALQAQLDRCTTDECIVSLYNGMFFALDLVQYEGMFLNLPRGIRLIASHLQEYAISYGNNILIDSRLESYGEFESFISLDTSGFARLKPKFVESIPDPSATQVLNPESSDMEENTKDTNLILQSVIYHKGQFLGVNNQGEMFLSKNAQEWSRFLPNLTFANARKIRLYSSGERIFAFLNQKDLYLLGRRGEWLKGTTHIQNPQDVFVYQDRIIVCNHLDNGTQWQMNSKALYFNNKPLSSAQRLFVSGDTLYVAQQHGIYAVNGILDSTLKPERFFTYPTNAKDLHIIGADNGLILGYVKSSMGTYAKIEAIFVTKDLQNWRKIPIAIPDLNKPLVNIKSFAYINGKIFLYGQVGGQDSSVLLSISDDKYHLKLFNQNQDPNQDFVTLYYEPKTNAQIIANIPPKSNYDIQILRKVGRFYEVIYRNLDRGIFIHTESDKPQKGYILDIQGMPIM